MSKCFLSGFGRCDGKITGEHYISRTLLEAISNNGTVQIGGLPWQESGILEKRGIGALVSNVLCESHNSGLSDLDSAAGKLFRDLNTADKDWGKLPTETDYDGALVERWFLKVMCGLGAGPKLNDGLVPNEWKRALVENEWSTGWGLYLPMPQGGQTLATEFAVETLVREGTKKVCAAKFRVAGVHFNLLLGKPDNPASWGIYHGRGIIFRCNGDEKRVGLRWPNGNDGAVIYTKIGSTSERPRQWRDWRE